MTDCTAVIVDKDFLRCRGLSAFLRKKSIFSHIREFDDIEKAKYCIDKCAFRTFILLDSPFDFFTSFGEFVYFCDVYEDKSIAVIDGNQNWRSILKFIEAGAKAYIPRGMNERDMEVAINQIAAGNVYMPSRLSLAPDQNKLLFRQKVSSPVECLTDRQRDVLTILADGKSNKEIARLLCISESTVKVHIAAAFRLLGVHNRVSAVAKFNDGVAKEYSATSKYKGQSNNVSRH